MKKISRKDLWYLSIPESEASPKTMEVSNAFFLETKGYVGDHSVAWIFAPGM